MEAWDYSVSLPFSHTAGLRAIKWSWHALARQPNWAWIAREMATAQASMDLRVPPLGSIDQYQWLWHLKNKFDCPWLEWKGELTLTCHQVQLLCLVSNTLRNGSCKSCLLLFLQQQNPHDFDSLYSGDLLVKSSIIDLDGLTIVISLWVKFWPQ